MYIFNNLKLVGLLYRKMLEFKESTLSEIIFPPVDVTLYLFSATQQFLQ